MFAIPGQSPVTISPAAEARIAKLMAKGGHHALKIGVKKGGCAGMEYTMDYVDEAGPADEVIEQGAARVIIAPMAQMFLFGTEIDYETSLLGVGLQVPQPQRRGRLRLRRVDPLRRDPRHAVSADPDWIRDLFADLGAITTRRMMGGLSVYADGRIFAAADREGTLHLRAKGAFAEDLAAMGARPFTYARPDGTEARMGYMTAARRRA